MRTSLATAFALLLTAHAGADEVTVRNDSLDNDTSGTIQAGFVAGEKAAAWLTSPCAGNIVAAQVFWRSLSGGAAQVVEDSINILRSGTFPVPGADAQDILGPVLNDGVINEYRYLDENNTIPLSVPVDAGETFVLALTFADPPPSTGPSVVNDSDGIQAGHNAIYASLGGGSFEWFSSSALGVQGDWVIRAVIDCPAGPATADLAVTLSADPPAYTAGAPLRFTITVGNAGPAGAGASIVDAFPGAYMDAEWTCSASGGAVCAASGSGTIAQNVDLPAGGQVVYTVDGIVAPGTTGAVSDSATAVVAAPATDPDPGNNTASIEVAPATHDTIFADGFDAQAILSPRIVPGILRPRAGARWQGVRQRDGAFAVPLRR
jgi:hypothetical protein